MAAKIQIKDTQIGSFGGIFRIFDRMDSTVLSGLIDRTLGPRCGRSGYSYSEIFKCFAAVYLCGDDAVEDINDFRGGEYTSCPSYRFCSHDTMLRSLSELSVVDTEVESACRAKYRFNINDRMNDLLVKSLMLSGLVKDRRRVTLDYDNQVIPTEKLDAKYTYKKVFGYFPDIAQIDLNPCYIENRDGNAPVKLEQDEVFDHYTHRCILTNDWTGSEEETVRFYNQRGASETTFDVMNNDFGWGSLPCSTKAQNTVFMILMAMTRNFYRAVTAALSEVREFKVEATSRVKRFVFRFMQVPFRWVRHGRQMILRLFPKDTRTHRHDG